ncbi:MAG: LuxR C-terminal-related transcriptional regulator [Nevskia sp.]|uniref:LuxR C-terminal-related transcriptional regulator n=1 Tax=Nevskia sp. TaxID=1929292 RepID=UPI0040370236
MSTPRPPASRYLPAERRALPAAFFAQRRPVVSVSAPAGYGKSSLLAFWQHQLAAQDWRIVALTVDADDRDGDRLIIDLLHAFAPADAQRSQMLLGGLGEQGKRAVILALLAELSVSTGRTALFIDDIHWLGEGVADATLRLLIAQQPDTLALVLSGRSNSTMLAAEALLDGRLHAYGPAQLAFNDADVAELLAQYGLPARRPLVRSIIDRTQGWPAVVRLLAMTLHGDDQHQDAFLDSMVERRQALTDYLSEVLLARLPPRSARFLVGISLLRRFNLPLAAAVTGMDDAARLLDDLERRALPLNASSDPAMPHALHPLVRDFLLARLRREEPEYLAEVAARARIWLESQQRIDSAIDLSLDIGDVAGAVGLIDRFARSAARHYGRHATFLYWCNKIPPAQLRRFPRIQVIRVWSLNVIRRYAEAEQLLVELQLQAADPALRAQDGGSDAGEIDEIVEFEQCVQMVLRDRWINLAAKVRVWLARWPAADALHRGMAHTMIGCGDLAASAFAPAIDSLRLGRQLMSDCNAHYVVAWANMWLIAALIKQGQYRSALHECEAAAGHVAAQLGGQTPAGLMLHSLRALVLYELNRLDEAGAALEHGLTALVEQSSVDAMITGHVTLARLQNARGTPLDALETLAEGEILGWAHGLPRLAIAAAAERASLLLRQGEIVQATEVWRDLKETVRQRAPGEGDLVLRDKDRRIEARLALARGAWSLAIELLEPALDKAVTTGQRRKQVELLVLQAIAAHSLPAPERALALLRRALDLAMPQAYVRVFADEGAPMLALLVRFEAALAGPSRGALREYLRQLIDATRGQAPDGAAAVDSAGMLQALTRREMRILRQLPSSLSNRELADVLFITEGTLKWHLKNIYSKLGVASRVAAIAVSRQHGLLD